jgi:acyl carrier protein
MRSAVELAALGGRIAEAVERTEADVAGACVLTADLGAGPELVVLVRSAGLCGGADLRDELVDAVGAGPGWPAVIVAADDVDYAALKSGPLAPDVVEGRPDVYRWTPPVAPAEVAVTEVIAEVLGRKRVSMSDNFLDLGGDSLNAIGVVYGLQERTGAVLPVEALFMADSVADLAAAAEGGAW